MRSWREGARFVLDFGASGRGLDGLRLLHSWHAVTEGAGEGGGEGADVADEGVGSGRRPPPTGRAAHPLQVRDRGLLMISASFT